MSEKLEKFRTLSRQLRELKDQAREGDDFSLSDIAHKEIELRQLVDSMSDEEKEALSLERRVSHLTTTPEAQTFAGVTEVVEIFVMERQPNGELRQTKLPGELLTIISNAVHEAIKAVGEDFAQQDVCRRLIADDPRLDLENLTFEFNFAQGLLQNHR